MCCGSSRADALDATGAEHAGIRGSEQKRGEPPLVLACSVRIEPENIEDCERSLAGGTVGELTVQANRFQELIEGTRVVRAGSKHDPPAIPRARVGRRDAGLAFKVLTAVLGLEIEEEESMPERLRAPVDRRPSEECFRLFAVATSHQDCCETDDGVRVGGRRFSALR